MEQVFIIVIKLYFFYINMTCITKYLQKDQNVLHWLIPSALKQTCFSQSIHERIQVIVIPERRGKLDHWFVIQEKGNVHIDTNGRTLYRDQNIEDTQET